MPVQKYYITGSLQQSVSDASKEAFGLPFGLLRAYNCYTSKRKGGVVKRGGSETETIAGSLNRPLGMGVYKSDTVTSLMPVHAKYVANFAGANWRYFASGAWGTLTAHTNTSFSSTKQTQFAQLGDVLCIAGKKPARWDDSGTEIEMMGYPAPSVAATFVTAAGALSPATGYTWIYTYYNSTTGKESDWSPVSANSGAQTSKKFTLTLPTTSPGSTADKKRIYRTEDGGSTYKFVANVDIATATYDDNTADASLGAEAPEEGKNGLPPSEAYIVEDYGARFWLNDADNPYQVCPSSPYTGNSNNVEYFDLTERLTASHEITGLKKTTAGMLLFGVRNISLLTGYDITTWRIEPLKEGIGTQFANSIVSNGDMVCFLGEGGFKALQNGQVKHISDGIDEDLRTLLDETYNYHFYVSAAYNPVLEQFLFCISASSGSGTPWELSASGALAEWEISATGVSETWDIPGAPAASSATTRVKVWGWNHKLDEWCEYAFAQCEDNNSGQYSINFLVTPYPSSYTLDPQQEITFLGIDGGSNAGIIVGGWRTDRSKDDSTNIEAEFITDRIAPGRKDDNFRRYRHLIFPGSYADPTTNGGTVQYIASFDDPHLRDYSGSLKSFSGSGDRKTFSEGLARWIHLVVNDSTANAGNLMCSTFSVNYLQKELKESR